LPGWAVAGYYTYEGGYQAIRQLLAQAAERAARPTALFIANDMMAVGALKALYDAGLHVPQDMAIITLGDPPFAAYTAPALTTLELPVVEAGQIAARLLVDWIKTGKPAQTQHITLKFDLRIRESCGFRL
jgi:LacI family transcriptional regulator